MTPILLLYARALDQADRTAEARAIVQEALPSFTGRQLGLAHRLLGQLFEREGNAVEGRRFYERAIELMPENTVAYIFLGTLHEREGDLTAAEHMFRRATQCTVGDLDEAWLNLGFAQLGLGRDGDSAASWHHVLQLNTSYEEALAALARLEE